MKKASLFLIICTLLISFGCQKQSDPISSPITSNIPMIAIQSGTFNMGDNFGDGYGNERPVHSVTLSAFMVSKTEITVSQWGAVTDTSPSYKFGGNLPVTNISWYDAIAFCNKLSIAEGRVPCYTLNGNTHPNSWVSDSIVMTKTGGYRLPTEAEWEYAARGCGQVIKYAGTSDTALLKNYAWYWSNSESIAHDVATKLPNSLGLYDMSGNVWEWCWDWHDIYSSSAVTNPIGASRGIWRTFRGGGYHWNNEAFSRLSSRGMNYPYMKFIDVGFRVVRD